MKRNCAFLVVFVLLSAMASATEGPVKGKKFEFSTAVSFSSAKLLDEDYTISVLKIPLRLGWFIFGGLEIEPEVQLSSPYQGHLNYFLQGNLIYNFKAPLNLVPFLGPFAGFGSEDPVVSIGGSEGAKVSAFGGIIGVRCLMGKWAAVRAEYRLKWLTHDAPYMGDFGPDKWRMSEIFVGLSIFF
jgi:hypothetical protein